MVMFSKTQNEMLMSPKLSTIKKTHFDDHTEGVLSFGNQKSSIDCQVCPMLEDQNRKINQELIDAKARIRVLEEEVY